MGDNGVQVRHVSDNTNCVVLLNLAWQMVFCVFVSMYLLVLAPLFGLVFKQERCHECYG